ncbi:hypothetical protein BDY21DRAFT_334012 [Lineolata rhizophorae]|uniref:Uncharacterized protein n=1 Tax=Lineolata rhizophorae TaxID=578093 RepID=A0A6A6PB85_9PEZI|nr:hypothetical protein BDY21DRAFT_334012 [Lineolata rhizophorae]
MPCTAVHPRKPATLHRLARKKARPRGMSNPTCSSGPRASHMPSLPPSPPPALHHQRCGSRFACRKAGAYRSPDGHSTGGNVTEKREWGRRGGPPFFFSFLGFALSHAFQPPSSGPSQARAPSRSAPSDRNQCDQHEDGSAGVTGPRAATTIP